MSRLGDPSDPHPRVAIIMGSKSDWATVEGAAKILEDFEVPHETKIVSAHRTPDLLFSFCEQAEARGIEVIIASAVGAAHLPGMIAAKTLVPVLGVPVKTRSLNGIDSFLSIAQMPKGIPVGTLAIGEARAVNAALLAVSILATNDASLRQRLRAYRSEQTLRVLQTEL